MKTLAQLYMQPSYDKEQIAGIRKIITDFLEPLGYMFDVDESGNLFCCHPESKCRHLLCAHMDMVKTGLPVARVVHFDGIVFGIDENNKLTSCGADDKNGIWLCLQAAKHSGELPPMLFVAHEEGAPHSIDDWLDVEENQALLSMFDNCLVLDRANNQEIIYAGSFKDYSHILACQWKVVNPDWHFAKGVMCDADRLINHIPCINLSIGYYNGHRESEYSDLNELLETKKALFKFLTSKKKDKINWNVIKEFENKGVK